MTILKQNPAAVFQAMQLVATLQKRLAIGVRFFNPKTQQELKTIEEILECLRKDGSVIQGGK